MNKKMLSVAAAVLLAILPRVAGAQEASAPEAASAEEVSAPGGGPPSPLRQSLRPLQPRIIRRGERRIFNARRPSTRRYSRRRCRLPGPAFAHQLRQSLRCQDGSRNLDGPLSGKPISF